MQNVLRGTAQRCHEKNSPLTLSFSSKRVRAPGHVDGVSVQELTIDTASDVTCVSTSFLERHPTLSFALMEPVPPSSRMQLRTANGGPLNVLGFISFTVKLGDVSRRVEALVVPSLGPDQILLDNDVMSRFGAVLDWNNERLTFESSTTTVPALHRKKGGHRNNSSSVCVAAVHRNAVEHPVFLRERFNIRPGHAMIVQAFTDIKPLADTDVVVEPRVLSTSQMMSADAPVEFERLIVGRTISTWNARDGSVYVHVANTSNEYLTLHKDLEVGKLSTVDVAESEHMHVHAVAATPTTKAAITAARKELVEPLQQAFADSTFSPEQQAQVSELCAKYRPVFSLNSGELGKCTTTEATFPMPPDTKPVSRRPYRANPRTEAVINKCVEDMLAQDIIE